MTKHTKRNKKNGLLACPALLLLAVLLAGFTLLNLFWPKRETSELENRRLAQLPAFSLKALADGSWTSGFASYMQDQIALRDTWIDLESDANALLLQKAEEGGILLGKDGWMFTKQFGVTAATQKQLDKNVDAVITFAQRHPGQVSFLLAPSASTIYPEELPAGAPMIDENGMLDSIFSKISPYASVLDLRESFTANKQSYLYYKTDHHWTTAGAYLAYQQFCAQQGLAPFDTAAHQSVEVGDFYGTHYSTARWWNVHPDTITYYPLENSMTIMQPSSETEFAPLATENLINTEKFATRDKYAAFLDGNNGYSVIEGNGTGGILVVKDSYANCFVPFLTENYAKIGVIDFRNFSYGLDALMESEGYDQVLVLYNFQTFISDAKAFNISRPSSGKAN